MIAGGGGDGTSMLSPKFAVGWVLTLRSYIMVDVQCFSPNGIPISQHNKRTSIPPLTTHPHVMCFPSLI